MAEIKERSLIHEGLKHYFLIRFAQRPGASRRRSGRAFGAVSSCPHVLSAPTSTRPPLPVCVRRGTAGLRVAGARPRRRHQSFRVPEEDGTRGGEKGSWRRVAPRGLSSPCPATTKPTPHPPPAHLRRPPSPVAHPPASQGPALVGIELAERGGYDELLARMTKLGVQFTEVNKDDALFAYLV